MPSAPPGNPAVSRFACPHCGHAAIVAIWCSGSCCDQSPEGFLLGALPRAERDAGVPAFAVRYLEPSREYSPDLPARVWRAGSLTPLFTGRLDDAVGVTMSHDCPPGD